MTCERTEFDLEADQFATSRWWMQWKRDEGDGRGLQPVDLTGYTLRCQGRQRVDDPDPPLFDLSTANGGIVVIDAADGQFEMVLTHQAAARLGEVTRIQADILAIDTASGEPEVIAEGVVRINKGSTRP